MSSHCLNCNAPITHKFCSHCGQSNATHKINGHFLWHEIQHGVFHVDKGILFTAKELFTRPGKSIREFLNGKRVNHFKPLSFVLVLAGIYGIITIYFKINILANNIEINGSGEEYEKLKSSVNEMSDWISHHYALFALLQIPIFTIGTFIAFKKMGENIFEHLVINTFLTGQRLILHIVAFPFYYIFNQTEQLRTVARYTDGLGYILMIWSLMQLFSGVSRGRRFIRIILSFIITFMIILIIMLVVFQLVWGTIKGT